MTIKPPIASCVRQLSPFLRYVVILIPLQHTKAGISTFQRLIFRLRKFYWHTTFTNPFTNFVPLSKLSSENVAPTDSSKTNRQTLKLWFKLVKQQSINRQLRTVLTVLTRWNCFHCHFDRQYCSIRSITIALDDHDSGTKYNKPIRVRANHDLFFLFLFTPDWIRNSAKMFSQ